MLRSCNETLYFEWIIKILNWVTEASFCCKNACDTALEPQRSIFSSYKRHIVCAHIRHILGTHQAHAKLKLWTFGWELRFFLKIYHFHLILHWATEASSCRRNTCDTTLEPQRSIFSSYQHRIILTNCMLTSGTSNWCMKISKISSKLRFSNFACAGVCLMCARIIYMALITWKYWPLRFQCRVARIFTTKARFCNLI